MEKKILLILKKPIIKVLENFEQIEVDGKKE